MAFFGATAFLGAAAYRAVSILRQTEVSMTYTGSTLSGFLFFLGIVFGYCETTLL